MKLAMIGLGKMGANMTRRLAGDGHEIVAYDVSTQAVDALAGELDGVTPARDPAEVVAGLPSPRVVWLMVPHQFVDATIDELLSAGLGAGDLVVDGGNSNYKLSQERAARLAGDGIQVLVVGKGGKHLRYSAGTNWPSGT